MARRKAGKKMAGKGKKGGARESLVVASKFKAYIKSKGFKSSSDLIDAANSAVHRLLDSAMERAGSNKRATVRPQDI
jgi:histone H3/H4